LRVHRLSGLSAAGVIALAQGALTVFAAFDLALAAASVIRPHSALPPGPKRRRFAVLVPARDEAAVIQRLLGTLEHLTYPSDRFEVFVVADNCSDDTASAARSRNARVFERRGARPGKAAALGWLVSQLPSQDFDAYVVVDADSVVSANLLEVVDAGLEAGYDAVQVLDGALDPLASPLAALAGLGLELNNHVRAVGRQALGLPSGLMGNGMAFTSETWKEIPWGSLGRTEDSEALLALVRSGRRIRYDSNATVRSDMADSWPTARDQNERWDRGRLNVAFSELSRLRFPRSRDAYLALVVADQAMPRSALYAINFALAGVLILLRRAGARLALCVMIAQALALAPAVSRVPLRQVTLAMRAAPRFLLWKTLLFVKLAFRRDPR
jgi:cellulose synthase/poly-beta-1,6-N-acetylglucosamine synthase-like glycosyltransferase